MKTMIMIFPTCYQKGRHESSHEGIVDGEGVGAGDGPVLDVVISALGDDSSPFLGGHGYQTFCNLNPSQH